MEGQKYNTFDIFIGGLSGAVVSAIIAVFLNIYFDSIERESIVNTKEKILEAKEIVTKEIKSARREEKAHLLEAIRLAEKAKVEADAAKKDAQKSVRDLEIQKDRVASIVKSIESKIQVEAQDIANILENEIILQLSDLVPKDAIMAFELLNCPKGWRIYEQAYGRFLRGIDKSNEQIDPDGERVPGSKQNDTFQGHYHNQEHGGSPGLWDSAQGTGPSARSALTPYKNRKTFKITDPKTDGKSGEPRTSIETRPKNIAVLYCIKN